MSGQPDATAEASRWTPDQARENQDAQNATARISAWHADSSITRDKLFEITGENSDERQKLNTIMESALNQNAQLGGKMATEIRYDSGRTTIIFAQTASRSEPYQMEKFAYGIDSVVGPFSLREDVVVTDSNGHNGLSLRHLFDADAARRDSNFIPIIDPEIAGKIPEETINSAHLVTEDYDMGGFKQAFDNSRETVLKDPTAMAEIASKRSRILDKTLSIVSEPIHLKNVAPQLAPAPVINPSE